MALTVTVPEPDSVFNFKISKPGYADHGKIFSGNTIEIHGVRHVELQRPDLRDDWHRAGWKPTADRPLPSITLPFDWVYEILGNTSEQAGNGEK